MQAVVRGEIDCPDDIKLHERFDSFRVNQKFLYESELHKQVDDTSGHVALILFLDSFAQQTCGGLLVLLLQRQEFLAAEEPVEGLHDVQ